jgi:NADH-quinone oxidoreductase subunit M
MDVLDFSKLTIPFYGILSPQGLTFLAFVLAFAIKVPLFPFHTWLPDAHVEAPTAGSVILAGVLLKMGTYGFVRFLLPFFPLATEKYLPILIAIAIIGIIYGAFVAFAQKDLKKLVAYSSVSHLGMVMLGIFVLNLQGVEGGIYQMINHGLDRVLFPSSDDMREEYEEIASSAGSEGHACVRGVFMRRRFL